MVAQSEEQTAPARGSLRQWIVDHDDKWTFIAPYIGLAVILSLVLSVFWLVVVVAVHFALEIIRQWIARPGWKGVILRSLWELKLDIALILFALTLSLYMEFILGVVGLGAAGRAGAMTGARVGARFGVLQRVLRGILLSLDDLAQVGRVIMRRKRSGAADEQALEDAAQVIPPEEVSTGWTDPWSRGDYISVAFGLVCLLLIALAPALTDHTYESVVVTLLADLHPFPGGE